MSAHKPGMNREVILPEDFAKRVAQRVEQIKRRRRTIRRLLTTAGALAIAAGATIFWQQVRLTEPDVVAARYQATAPDWPALPASMGATVAPMQDQGLVGYFFPDADPVRDFNQSFGEAGWHSYDSWWTSNS